MLNVTKTYLPPIEEYTAYLRKIWQNGWVTNNGPLLVELEERLKKYLGVKHLFFTSNGTIAIQIAIKALDIHKEIITTPFSYVATTNSILWENCKPVFVDVDAKTCCINPDLIEKKITRNTQAILATHVYGIPCAVEKIEKLAKKHKLKVIYDAAHSFGTQYKGKSLAGYGDVSTLSFHATKLFHTIEGGAIITNSDAIAKKVFLYRSFGHIDETHLSAGVNGKNSEFHAAMGLCIMDKIPAFLKKREELSKKYDALLSGNGLRRPVVPENTKYNYAYYPILLKNEKDVLKVRKELLKNDISPRRYFYPSLNKLPYVKGEKCPASESIASRVLCLPLSYELSNKDLTRTAQIVVKALK